jgi:DNA-binding transcriptional regulator LsrR (DeoR family)
LGALHVEQLIHENSTIDISWGTGVFEVVNSLSAHLMPGIKVIQIIGAAGGKSDPNVDGPELARLLADKYGATYVSLHVPLLVDKPTTRQVLLSENEIKETLQQALKADFALVGIGSVEPESSTSYIRAGYLSQAQIAAVKSQGAVGSICGYLYDLRGNILDNELNQRIVAVDLKKLLHSRCEVIGIATGDYKVPAVLGALRGNLVKTIVIDSSIAEKILNAED